LTWVCKKAKRPGRGVTEEAFENNRKIESMSL